MIKTSVIAAVVATGLMSAAFAQSTGEKTGVNSALGVAPKTEDFIREAATSDMLEIAAAKIAEQKGTPGEKRFAQAMVKDHTKTSSELKGVTPDNLKSAIPASLDSSSQQKLDKLNSAQGADFASNYDPMQVSAHKDAVSLFERYAKGGDNPKLKSWAGRTLPNLRHHLEMAEALDKGKK